VYTPPLTNNWLVALLTACKQAMPAIPEEDATNDSTSNRAGSSRRRHSSSVLIKTAAQLIVERSGGALALAEAELLVSAYCNMLS
jgi:hypothetical protein